MLMTYLTGLSVIALVLIAWVAIQRARGGTFSDANYLDLETVVLVENLSLICYRDVVLDPVRDRLYATSRSPASVVALDLDDPIAGSYTLEVSSPGLERPLRRPEHFAGAVGELVTVRTRPGPDGRRRLRGVLVSATGSAIRIEEATDVVVTVGLDEIESARTVFEWGPSDRPPSNGKKPRKGTSR